MSTGGTGYQSASELVGWNRFVGSHNLSTIWLCSLITSLPSPPGMMNAPGFWTSWQIPSRHFPWRVELSSVIFLLHKPLLLILLATVFILPLLQFLARGSWYKFSPWQDILWLGTPLPGRENKRLSFITILTEPWPLTWLILLWAFPLKMYCPKLKTTGIDFLVNARNFIISSVFFHQSNAIIKVQITNQSYMLSRRLLCQRKLLL